MDVNANTFRKFTPEQAAQYAKARGFSYPKAMYQAILDFHTGDHDLMYDVGTGPGKVAFDFLPHFKRVLGSDGSPKMIEQAEKDAELRGEDAARRSRFFAANAEECGEKLPAEEKGQVDLITVAMAAHWFEMEAFYVEAAKALKPGGTLAMWTCVSIYCHPSEPEHEKIQAILNKLEHEDLAPYMSKGNQLSASGYDDLALPWQTDKAKSAFDESSFKKYHWDRKGVPSAPPNADGTPGPFLHAQRTPVKFLEAAWGSSSGYIRWSEANPDKAGTDQDVRTVAAKGIRELMGDKKDILVSPSIALLLMRRSS